MGVALGVLGVLLAVGVSGIASSFGLRNVGSAVNAAMMVEPKHFGKYLVLSVLPGTQGIYGFVIAFLAIAKITPEMSLAAGLALMIACLPVGICGLSSILQGQVAAGSVEMTVKKPNESGKALVLAVFIEFYSILGFVISIMLLGLDIYKG